MGVKATLSLGLVHNSYLTSRAPSILSYLFTLGRTTLERERQEDSFTLAGLLYSLNYKDSYT